MSEAAQVRIDKLQVSYGRVQALAGVDLELPPGPVGLLGPNGAGKTTLLRVLLGHCRAASGSVRVGTLDPQRAGDCLEIRRLVGYMPEGPCLLPGMNGLECVATLARLAGLARTDAMTRAHEVLDYVGLEESRYRDSSGYSTGMKQRLKLAQGLAHDPPLLLLDEPTNGLDPRGRRHMLDLIAELGHLHQKNILLCSHLLPDVERTCDHVVILNRGRVAASGSIQEMTRSEGHRVVVQVQGDLQALLVEAQARGLQVEVQQPGEVEVILPDDMAGADILFACAQAAGVTLSGLQTRRRSLEDVFLSLLEAAA